MSSKLIIGLALGYDYEMIQPFILSLLKHRYDGEVVIIADERLQIPREVSAQMKVRVIVEPRFNRTNLKRAYIKFLSFPVWRQLISLYLRLLWKISENLFLNQFISLYQCQTGRYGFYYRFLKQHHYDKIFFTDIRDVIFQADPFEGFDDTLVVFHESPSITIKQEEHNSRWIREGFGHEVFSRLADQKIYCSGTIMGNHKGMLQFIKTFLETCLDNAVPINSKGIDQGVFNYMIHTNRLTNYKKFDNGNIVFTISPDLAEKVEFVQDKIYINKRLPLVVHQYDRYPHIFKFVTVQLEAVANK